MSAERLTDAERESWQTLLAFMRVSECKCVVVCTCVWVWVCVGWVGVRLCICVRECPLTFLLFGKNCQTVVRVKDVIYGANIFFAKHISSLRVNTLKLSC